jgi:hypothetical protein
MNMPCDIVLLPSKELSNKAVEASKATSRYDSFFTLKVGKFYPHMSLYMFQLNETDIPNVKAILSDIAQRTPIISATATGYSLGRGLGVGYVDPQYEVTNELSSLQNTVVDAINPVRAGMRESDVAKLQDARGLKRENLQKFGYPAIGGLFRPHMTLTRLKTHNPDVLKLLPSDVTTFSGEFDRIGLFEMGTNGTCIRQIATWCLA